MLKSIVDNPYRTLGVLSNTPLKERVANVNRLKAFAKVGKSVDFPADFSAIISQNPQRGLAGLTAAVASLNLDRDRLRYALTWFISTSAMDSIALNNLQAGNTEKAKEILSKKESASSLINQGVLAFIEGDIAAGFTNIMIVIHTPAYLSEFLHALDLDNVSITEDEISEIFITDLLKEIPANVLLSANTNTSDHETIAKRAICELLSLINSEVSLAGNADSKNAEDSLSAGTRLMNSTKEPLKLIKDIVGASSEQYRMTADGVANQVLQCGINYYNNAPDWDVNSPRKAIVLQEYALKLAVGKLTKDRCQHNYDILKKVVDNMPPDEVVVETRRIKEELRKFCQEPDKISYSITLLNNTKSLLQEIKAKLGASNAFYLSLSTQVVGNALHNVIEEVNSVQNYFTVVLNAIKESGVDPRLLNYLDDANSPAKIIETKVKPVMREAWKATELMDSFDIESEFRTKRYNPNRQSLKEVCNSLNISTSTSRVTTSNYTPPRPKVTLTTITPQPPETGSIFKTLIKWFEKANDVTGGCLGTILGYILVATILGAIGSLF